MKLEDQVCSLELAKRLKELGVKQESYFSWVGREHSLDGSDVFDVRPSNYREYAQEDEWTFSSAFTVAEFIEMIEDSQNEWAVGYNDSGCFYHFRKGGRGSGNMIESCEQKESRFDSEATPFVNAIAEWVIHLVEKNLLNKNYLVTP